MPRLKQTLKSHIESLSVNRLLRNLCRIYIPAIFRNMKIKPAQAIISVIIIKCPIKNTIELNPKQICQRNGFD